MSLLYMAFFLAIQLARLVTDAPARSDEYPPALAIIAAYVAAGMGGGIVMGLLRPWLQHPRYRWVCGVLIAVPVAFSVQVALYGLPVGWGPKRWVALALMSAVFGIVGVQGWGAAPSYVAPGPGWGVTPRPSRPPASSGDRPPTNDPYPPAAS